MKHSEFVGQPVTYTSGIPAQSSGTAFVTAVNEEQERVDLLVLDEGKKNLLSGGNWWMAFRRVHDVPHVSEGSERHGFELLNAVPAAPLVEKPAEASEQAEGPALVAAAEKFDDSKAPDAATRAEEAADEVNDAVQESRAPKGKKKVSG